MDAWEQITAEYQPIDRPYTVERWFCNSRGDKDFFSWECVTLAQAVRRYHDCDQYRGSTYAKAIYFTFADTSETMCIQSSESEEIERRAA